jgi:DNA-binding MarR family transcriptional regulator
MAKKVPIRQHPVNPARPDRTSGGDAVSELVIHVFRLNGLLIAAGDSMARPAGQTSARWRVLAAIDEAPLSVAQIARAWWLTRQSVQRVADVLVRDGLAIYEDNPNHRRAKLVRITPQGLTTLRAIRTRQRAWADALGSELREADIRAANAVLGNMVRVLARR